ncbi:MAG: hypothetical protein ACRDJL_07080 [Actinomycetota bacterium]
MLRTTAMTSANTRITTSATKKILTFSPKAPSTDGEVSVPLRDCTRSSKEKKRSPTSCTPGLSATMRARAPKKTTVLAVDTSTPRPPSMREPRVETTGAALSGSTSLRGPLPPMLT